MAGSVNKVILIGNLGQEPKVSVSKINNKEIVTFSVATSNSWVDKETGRRTDKTEWHNVVIYNERLTKIAKDYLKKGGKVYIEGSLQTREWEDVNKVKRYRTEVVLQFNATLLMLDSKAAGQDYESYSDSNNNYSTKPASKGGGPADDFEDVFSDDDIPF